MLGGKTSPDGILQLNPHELFGQYTYKAQPAP